MMKKIFLIMMCIVLIYLASAETSLFGRQNEDYDLKFACELNGGICPATTSCNISINYPNSTALISNQQATNLNNGLFNYFLNENQTTIKGEYNTLAYCIDSASNLNGTVSFVYEINPTGIRPSDQKTSSTSIAIYFTLIIGILFFLGFLFVNSKPPAKWTFFIFALFFFLITLNILFVGLQDAVVNPRLESFFDSFTAISFYVYWFLAGVLAIMWFLTFLQTYFYNRNLRNLQKYGIA